MIRESGSIMVGQYFRKRRDGAEAATAAAQGAGMAAMAALVDKAVR